MIDREEYPELLKAAGITKVDVEADRARIRCKASKAAALQALKDAWIHTTCALENIPDDVMVGLPLTKVELDKSSNGGYNQPASERFQTLRLYFEISFNHQDIVS